MDQGDHRGAFADGAADALDRARAHVADREHAGHAGFQRRRGLGRKAAARRVGPVSTKPCRRAPRRSLRASRSRARRRRTGTRCAPARSSSAPLRRSRQVTPSRPLPARRAARVSSVCGMQLDVGAWPRCGRSGSATCVAARPGPRTSMWTLAACCDRNTAAWPAELPPPTSATSCCAHMLGLERRGPVPDAAAFEFGQPRHLGPAVARAAGDHHGAARSRRPSASGTETSPRVSARAAVERLRPAPGSASRRRTSAPARRRARPAPGPRCRSGKPR